jgi:hypothetical protein
MHSQKHGGLQFTHNGDYSGEVEINNLDENVVMTVDMQDLLDFVAEYVRSKRISELEQMSTKKLLK